MFLDHANNGLRPFESKSMFLVWLSSWDSSFRHLQQTIGCFSQNWTYCTFTFTWQAIIYNNIWAINHWNSTYHVFVCWAKVVDIGRKNKLKHFTTSRVKILQNFSIGNSDQTKPSLLQGLLLQTELNQPPVSTAQHFFWLAVLNRCFLEKLLLLLSNYWNPHLKHDTLLL